MKQYIIRRILISLIVLVGVSFLLYTIIYFMPGDFVSTVTSGNPYITDEMKQKLRELYGTDKGLLEGYFDWALAALKGDFGTSFVFQQPVTQVIKDRMWVSFWLSFIAFIIQIAIALPLGTIAATKQYSKIDYSIRH